VAFFQLVIDGEPVEDEFYLRMTSLEVEENADLPGAFRLRLPVSADGSDDLRFVNDPRLQPLRNVAVIAQQGAGPATCVFDGLVLSHKLHLTSGLTDSTLEVWGQDASWEMNLEEKVREWVDLSDASVARAVFADYGIEPDPANTLEDSPVHTERGHSLMQRASDIQFLRQLARRNGKLCRVVSGEAPGDRSGFFASPQLDAEPVLNLVLNDPSQANVTALDFEWDVTRPTEVRARQALMDDPSEDGASGDSSSSGWSALDQRDLATFAGRPMSILLTAPVDDGLELRLRAQSLLRESGWFVRCQGQADAGQLGAVMRVGQIVQVEAAGSLNSGKYYVWSVHHTFTAEAHQTAFKLQRNAVGPTSTGGGPLGVF
jgi:phage protein D